MHVIYKPENPADGDRQEWDFVPGRVRASQAEVLERLFGGTWDEFQVGVQQGKMRARRVMLWYLMQLTHATLRFEDVPDFYSDELEVSYSVAELTKLREAILKANMPAEQRDVIVTAVDNQMTEAMEREGASADPGKAPSGSSLTDGVIDEALAGTGKAPSETSSTDGGSPSPSN